MRSDVSLVVGLSGIVVLVAVAGPLISLPSLIQLPPWTASRPMVTAGQAWRLAGHVRSAGGIETADLGEHFCEAVEVGSSYARNRDRSSLLY